jgi:hypothetical protein
MKEAKSRQAAAMPPMAIPAVAPWEMWEELWWEGVGEGDVGVDVGVVVWARLVERRRGSDSKLGRKRRMGSFMWMVDIVMRGGRTGQVEDLDMVIYHRQCYVCSRYNLIYSLLSRHGFSRDDPDVITLRTTPATQSDTLQSVRVCRYLLMIGRTQGLRNEHATLKNLVFDKGWAGSQDFWRGHVTSQGGGGYLYTCSRWKS